MMTIFRIALLIFSLTTSIHIHAEWFDAKGRAPILNNNKDIARNMAVQDALQHALLFTGAQVSSVAQLSNGLLSNEQFEVKSNGSVRTLQLISEDSANNNMVVHIRVDIVPTETASCPASHLVKLVAMTKFPLRHRQQASNGAIFNIGNQTAHQFFNKTSNIKGSFQTTKLLPVAQTFSQPFSANNNQQIPQQLLAQQADSQYLLTAAIEDVSLAKPTSSWLGLISDNPMRTFTSSFTLYDGLDGQKIWNKRYSTVAPWTFKRTEKVDLASQQFWKSPYGASINSQLDNAISDLNQTLHCMEVKGSVIRVDDDFLTINLGLRNGVKKGDKLNVYHINTFTDNRGLIRQSTIINPTQFVVNTVYSHHLEATPENGILYGDVQNDSLVVFSK